MTAHKVSCALGLAMVLAIGPAHAQTVGQTLPEVRSVFCVAVRTVPLLDQNNFPMGASGTVYTTGNFESSLSLNDVNYAWNGFIGAKHKVVNNDNPNDTCHPAVERRELMKTFTGNVKFKSVKWPVASEK